MNTERSMESTDISGSGNGETTQFLNVTKLLNKEKTNGKNDRLSNLSDSIDNCLKGKYRKSIMMRAVQPGASCSTPFLGHKTSLSDSFLNLSALSVDKEQEVLGFVQKNELENSLIGREKAGDVKNDTVDRKTSTTKRESDIDFKKSISDQKESLSVTEKSLDNTKTNVSCTEKNEISRQAARKSTAISPDRNLTHEFANKSDMSAKNELQSLHDLFQKITCGASCAENNEQCEEETNSKQTKNEQFQYKLNSSEVSGMAVEVVTKKDRSKSENMSVHNINNSHKICEEIEKSLQKIIDKSKSVDKEISPKTRNLSKAKKSYCIECRGHISEDESDIFSKKHKRTTPSSSESRDSSERRFKPKKRGTSRRMIDASSCISHYKAKKHKTKKHGSTSRKKYIYIPEAEVKPTRKQAVLHYEQMEGKKFHKKKVLLLSESETTSSSSSEEEDVEKIPKSKSGTSSHYRKIRIRPRNDRRITNLKNPRRTHVSLFQQEYCSESTESVDAASNDLNKKKGFSRKEEHVVKNKYGRTEPNTKKYPHEQRQEFDFDKNQLIASVANMINELIPKTVPTQIPNVKLGNTESELPTLESESEVSLQILDKINASLCNQDHFKQSRVIDRSIIRKLSKQPTKHNPVLDHMTPIKNIIKKKYVNKRSLHDIVNTLSHKKANIFRQSIGVQTSLHKRDSIDGSNINDNSIHSDFKTLAKNSKNTMKQIPTKLNFDNREDEVDSSNDVHAARSSHIVPNVIILQNATIEKPTNELEVNRIVTVHENLPNSSHSFSMSPQLQLNIDGHDLPQYLTEVSRISKKRKISRQTTTVSQSDNFLHGNDIHIDSNDNSLDNLPKDATILSPIEIEDINESNSTINHVQNDDIQFDDHDPASYTLKNITEMNFTRLSNEIKSKKKCETNTCNRSETPPLGIRRSRRQRTQTINFYSDVNAPIIETRIATGQKVQGNVSKNKKKGRNAETSKLSKTSEKKTKSVEQPESVEKSDEQVITKRKVKKGRRKPKLTIPRNKNKRAVKKKNQPCSQNNISFGSVKTIELTNNKATEKSLENFDISLDILIKNHEELFDTAQYMKDLDQESMKIQHLGQEKTELYKKSELYGYLAIAPNNYKNFANEKFVQRFWRLEGTNSVRIGNLFLNPAPSYFTVPKDVPVEIANTGICRVLLLYALNE